VTTLVGSSDGARVISGGKEGNVRVWRIGAESQTMVASMKEHKGCINSLALRANDSECVSASSDGSCIVWDLDRFVRQHALTANTFFKACAYHPDESQIVTGGTDRKVTWWDSFDGSAIRVLDGSDTAEINALDVSTCGNMMVTGGADKAVTVWGYDSGTKLVVGKGHSGAVTKVKFTPDGEKIVSVGAEGAIFIWSNVVQGE
jgi:WD40 repeat protein